VPSQAQGSELKVAQQYMMLIYPFRHSMAGKERAERLEQVGECWRSWWSRLSRTELEVAKDDTYFYYPYVRELLFPELCVESCLDPSNGSQGRLPQEEQLSRLGAASMANLPVNAVLRLSFSPDRLKDLRSLSLELERKGPEGEIVDSFSARFVLDWVDVALFPQHVGFLILKIHLAEDALTVGRVRSFQNHIRLVLPRTVGWELASWRGAGEGTSFKFKSRDLVDYLLQGLVGTKTTIEPIFASYIEMLAKSAANSRYTQSPDGQTYGQTFNIFAFCLLKNTPAPPIATLASESEFQDTPTSGAKGPPLFDSPSRQALYELATCTDSAAPDFVPHPRFLKELWDRNYFAHWDNWQGMTLHDNVIFLGTRESGFTRHALAHNVESDYFTLYLFALFQKVRLRTMFGELMKRDSHLHKNLERARHLWNSFLAFQDHYWLSEVTRSQQGKDLYHYYQEALDVISLHRQMSGQVKELQTYYEGKFERRLARLMNLLTFIGVPSTLVFTLFSRYILPDHMSKMNAGIYVICVYFLFFILWGVWTYYIPE
jgi:hypothetical protein